jgi:hypothetical protein
MASLCLPKKASLLMRIESALDRLDALAFVARAHLGKDVFRSHEIDSCDDVPAMARSDAIWSMAIVFAIARLLRDLGLSKQTIDTVDVYLDPRDLKSRHQSVWERTIRESVVRQIRHFGSQLRPPLLRGLAIRNIEFIRKPRHGNVATEFQLCTGIAHKLCSRSSEIFMRNQLSRIKRKDISEIIKKTVRQWDGIPYNDT